jgi:hypothetical protein
MFYQKKLSKDWLNLTVTLNYAKTFRLGRKSVDDDQLIMAVKASQ